MRRTASIILLAGFATAALASGGHDHDHGHGSGHHWLAPDDAAGRKNPVARNAASIQRGKKTFQQHCVSCHGAEARGDGPAGKSLKPKPTDLKAMSSIHPDGDFAWKIANGRGGMPAWKAVLKKNQIWDLVNFIQSLSEKNEKRHSDHDHEH